MTDQPEMIERVARAINDAGWPDSDIAAEAWEDGVWRACAMGQARAAIAAMREPTAAMVDAAILRLVEHDGEIIAAIDVRAAIEAAIDAALEGK